jgi:hypothetical protein
MAATAIEIHQPYGLYRATIVARNITRSRRRTKRTGNQEQHSVAVDGGGGDEKVY